MTFSYKKRISDFFRLFACLHPLRTLNYILIQTSYLVSRLLRRAFVFSYPFSLTFEVSSICNLMCPQCLAGRRETNRANRFISISFVEKMLSLFKNKSFYVNFYMQGEPLLNNSLPAMIKKAKNLNYYTYLSTNGTLLSEEKAGEIVSSGLDRLVVSVDGITQETYSFYRQGGKLNDVISGIKNLQKARERLYKNNPLLIMQFLVNKKNEHELPDLKTFAKSSGFDMLQLKSMQVYDNPDTYLPMHGSYNRYNKKQKKSGCFRLWSHAVFTSDEALVPCCYDKKPDCAMKITHADKKSIWYNSRLQKIRKQVNGNRSSLDICKECNE